MKNGPRLVPKKRLQIEKAQAVMFGSLIAASIIVSFSLITLNFLWKRKQFNDRVAAKKELAVKTLEQNVENAKKLQTSFLALEQDPKVNSRTVLDALPSTYDYAALLTSIDSLIKRSSITAKGFDIGQDQSPLVSETANSEEPYAIKVSMDIDGTYGNIQDFIRKLDLSIRPIVINNVNFIGTAESMNAKIEATTYILIAKKIEVRKETVQ